VSGHRPSQGTGQVPQSRILAAPVADLTRDRKVLLVEADRLFSLA
jgi:hypothetical protein